MSDLFGSDLSDIDGSNDGSMASRTPTPPPRATSRGYHERSSGTPPPKGDLSDGDSSAIAPGPRRRSPSPGSAGGGVDGLFGSDSESGSTPRGRRRGYGGGSASERSDHSDGERMDDAADDEDEGRVQVRVMSARVPVLPRPHSSSGRYILARTPNLMQLEPTPFSAAAYQDLLEEEHRVAETHGFQSAVTPDLAAAAESIIANTVRWRRVAGPGGAVRRESNARLVRWSDGSTTVVIGGGVPEVHSISVEQLASQAKEQHYYAAAHQPRELLMQNHARLTESWLIRPPRQSAQVRAAVALLLDRVQVGASGKVAQSASRAARGAGMRAARTRFMVLDEDPELRIKHEEKEEEKRERLRRKEERQRERREAREFQAGRGGYGSGAYGGADDYSDEDVNVGYTSGGGGGATARDRVQAPRRLPGRFGALKPEARGHDDYMDEDGDGFIVDDDAELEVGSRDEFDDEEEQEQEEELAAQRLRAAKRADSGDDEGRRRRARARSGKSRRLLNSDDDDDDDDDF
ncbi:Paf1 complex component [Coemansia biformis]|uniref:Paf1 complex component n=1 Tax=Coemansia biformis TaxID=1286918 RepID=A0A9W8CY72_9FUNG|nr:Paf1 complex component [Coemansia biformis]